MDLATVTSLRSAHSRADLALAAGEAVVGGGSWLFSEPQPAITGLVDLTTLGWPSLETLPNGALRIGATCTISELVDAGPHPLVRSCAEALLMSFKVWQQATVGGNVALALPAGAMVSLLVALDGLAEVWCPGEVTRFESVAGLVRGVQSTSLAPGEVLRAIEVPAATLSLPTAFRQLSLSPAGRSATVVIGRQEADGLTLFISAATTRPVILRWGAVPNAAQLDEALASINCWYADAHGPVDWRQHITAVLAREVCEELR